MPSPKGRPGCGKQEEQEWQYDRDKMSKDQETRGNKSYKNYE